MARGGRPKPRLAWHRHSVRIRPRFTGVSGHDASRSESETKSRDLEQQNDTLISHGACRTTPPRYMVALAGRRPYRQKVGTAEAETARVRAARIQPFTSERSLRCDQSSLSQLVTRLHSLPVLSVAPTQAFQRQRHGWRNAGMGIQQSGQRMPRDAKPPGAFRHRPVLRLHAVADNLSRMGRVAHGHEVSSNRLRIKTPELSEPMIRKPIQQFRQDGRHSRKARRRGVVANGRAAAT